MWSKEKQGAEGIDYEIYLFIFNCAELGGEQNICNDMPGKQAELLFWRVLARSEVRRWIDLWIISIEVVVKFVFSDESG